MALGSTQALTKMSTRGVQVAGTEGSQPFSLHLLILSKSGSLNPLEPPGPVTCLYMDCLEASKLISLVKHSFLSQY